MFTVDSPTSIPTPAKTTARPTASYEDYVIRFARQMARLVFVAFAGVALAGGAAMYAPAGTVMVLMIAIGLGLAAGGAVGAAEAAGAHGSYTRNFGRIETTH